MEGMRIGRGRGSSLVVVGAALLCSMAPGHVRAEGNAQARTLGTLIVRTAICFAHPCIGDTKYEAQQVLKGRLVSDGYFDYTDLATAYPSVRGVLQGVVELNFEGKLHDISLIVVGFQVPRDVLREELERTLPGCEIQTDSEDQDDEDDAGDVSDTTIDWDCSVHLSDGHRFDLALHLAPEVVMVEIKL